jgi:Zn finger protein HypA/HybF involved in hydrogenase expression
METTMTLDTVLFNDITLGQLIPWLIAAVSVYLIVKLYRTFFMKRKVKLQHSVYFVCSHCSWEGHISKFGTCCPKCGTPADYLGNG